MSFLDEHNKVEVVPHVVLIANMLLEGDMFVVEGLKHHKYITIWHTKTTF